MMKLLTAKRRNTAAIVTTIALFSSSLFTGNVFAKNEPEKAEPGVEIIYMVDERSQWDPDISANATQTMDIYTAAEEIRSSQHDGKPYVIVTDSNTALSRSATLSELSKQGAPIFVRGTTEAQMELIAPLVHQDPHLPTVSIADNTYQGNEPEAIIAGFIQGNDEVIHRFFGNTNDMAEAIPAFLYWLSYITEADTEQTQRTGQEYTAWYTNTFNAGNSEDGGEYQVTYKLSTADIGFRFSSSEQMYWRQEAIDVRVVALPGGNSQIWPNNGADGFENRLAILDIDLNGGFSTNPYIKLEDWEPKTSAQQVYDASSWTFGGEGGYESLGLNASYTTESGTYQDSWAIEDMTNPINDTMYMKHTMSKHTFVAENTIDLKPIGALTYYQALDYNRQYSNSSTTIPIKVTVTFSKYQCAWIGCWFDEWIDRNYNVHKTLNLTWNHHP